VPILERMIRAIKQRCPDAAVVVRGDSAFAMERLEALSDPTTRRWPLCPSGWPRPPACAPLAAPLLAEAAAQYDATKHFVRRFTWLSYAADSWPRKRDVVLKVEHWTLRTDGSEPTDCGLHPHHE